jgi:carbamoyl-phosphate synthase large subunit
MKSLEGDAELFAGDVDPYAAGLYLVRPERRVMLGRGDDADYAEHVLELCRRKRIDAVIPTGDSKLFALALCREQFEAIGVRLLLASTATLRLCLDEWALHQRCAGHVRAAQSVGVDDSFDAAEVRLPAVVKSRFAGDGPAPRIVHDRDELDGLPRDASLIVQELLTGPEYSIDVLASASAEVLAAVPKSRLKTDAGVAIAGRTIRDPTLESFGREVAQLVGLTGAATVRVKCDADGEPVLTGISPGCSSSIQLTIAAGVDVPGLWLAEALGELALGAPREFSEVAMVRHLHEQFVSTDELAAMEQRGAAAEQYPLAA